MTSMAITMFTIGDNDGTAQEEEDFINVHVTENNSKPLPSPYVGDNIIDADVINFKQVSEEAACSDIKATDEALHDIDKTGTIKYRIIKAIACHSLMFGLGLGYTLLPPALVNLEVWFSCDTTSILYTFTAFGAGYIAGSLISMAIYDLMAPELLFGMAICINGVTVIIAPFTGHLYAFVCSYGIIGTCMGFLDSGQNPYGINLWLGHPWQRTLFQLQHSICSIGAVIGPFIVHPFLTELPYAGAYNGTYGAMNITHWNATRTSLDPLAVDSLHELAADLSPQLVNLEAIPAHVVSNIVFAFITQGSLILLGAFPFFLVLLLERPQIYKKKTKETSSVSSQSPKKSFKVIFLTFFFIFFVMQNFNYNVHSLLATYAVKYLHWRIKQGALLVATIQVANLFGLIISILLAKALHPERYVFMNMLILISGYIIFVLTPTPLPEGATWVATFLVGLGFSSTYGEVYLWANAHMPMTGRVAAVGLVGYGVGQMVSPMLTGHVFQHVGPLYFMYTLLGVALLQLCLYVGAVVFTSCYGAKSTPEKTYVTTVMDSLMCSPTITMFSPAVNYKVE